MTATVVVRPRAIVHLTEGTTHGPITRLMSPGDLGELLKPFIFLDIFSLNVSGGKSSFGMHPHSGIATVTFMTKGDVSYEDTTGATGLPLAIRASPESGSTPRHWPSPSSSVPGRETSRTPSKRISRMSVRRLAVIRAKSIAFCSQAGAFSLMAFKPFTVWCLRCFFSMRLMVLAAGLFGHRPLAAAWLNMSISRGPGNGWPCAE